MQYGLHNDLPGNKMDNTQLVQTLHATLNGALELVGHITIQLIFHDHYIKHKTRYITSIRYLQLAKYIPSHKSVLRNERVQLNNF